MDDDKTFVGKIRTTLKESTEGIPYGGKHLFFTIILTFVLLVVSCIAVFFTSLQGAEQVMVPNVVGKTLTNALLEMQQKELYPKIQLRYSDKMSDAGTILDQSPEAGAIVKAYRRVTITVSRGVAMDYIEDFTGKKIEEILPTLQASFSGENSLVTIAEPIYKMDSKEKGTIIAQNPPAGTYINDKMTLNLIVSGGQSEVKTTVPNIKGQSLQQLAKTLPTARVIFDFSGHEAFSGEKANTVTNLELSGENVPEWTRIKVDVAFGENTEKSTKGILSCQTQLFPYPVSMRLCATTKDGKTTTLLNFYHDGGNVSVPYDVEKGTTLTLYAQNREIHSKRIE